MLEGMNKKYSYDKFWLRSDMNSLAALFEYSDVYARRKYNFIGKFDKILFVEVFMNSRLRELMEVGHPTLLSEASIDTFEKFIDVDCDGSLKQFRTIERLPSLHKDQLFWVGEAYAYIHYYADLPSKIIVQHLPIEYMLQQYITGHQVSFANFFERIKPILTSQEARLYKNYYLS